MRWASHGSRPSAGQSRAASHQSRPLSSYHRRDRLFRPRSNRWVYRKKIAARRFGDPRYDVGDCDWRLVGHFFRNFRSHPTDCRFICDRMTHSNFFAKTSRLVFPRAALSSLRMQNCPLSNQQTDSDHLISSSCLNSDLSVETASIWTVGPATSGLCDSSPAKGFAQQLPRYLYLCS